MYSRCTLTILLLIELSRSFSSPLVLFTFFSLNWCNYLFALKARHLAVDFCQTVFLPINAILSLYLIRPFLTSDFFKKMGHSRLLFLYFHLFYKQLTVNKCSIKVLRMTGFEPGSSGIGSNHSANCATTTAQPLFVYFCSFHNSKSNTPQIWLLMIKHKWSKAWDSNCIS